MRKMKNIFVILLPLLFCVGCENNIHNEEVKNTTTLLEAWKIAENEARDGLMMQL